MLKKLFKNKRLVIGVAVALALILIFVVVRARGQGTEVKMAKAERGNILSTISASGLVRANSVQLGSARMAGRVEWVGAEEGARVSKGQVLVKLDGYDQANKEYNRLLKLHKQGFVSDLELERARTAVDNSRVVAPFAGVVTEKAVIPGEAISPGVPVMTVVDVYNPWVEIQIDEVDIAVVRVGDRVRFTTDAFPDEEFFGKIVWINKKAELKKVGGRVRMDEEDLIFRGKVRFEDGSDKLRPGMSVYVEIITGEKKNVVTVPREAVTLREGKTVVFVLNRGRAVRTEVEIGIKDPEKVEILKGVSAGEKIAVSSLDKLRDNARVKIEDK